MSIETAEDRVQTATAAATFGRDPENDQTVNKYSETHSNVFTGLRQSQKERKQSPKLQLIDVRAWSFPQKTQNKIPLPPLRASRGSKPCIWAEGQLQIDSHIGACVVSTPEEP